MVDVLLYSCLFCDAFVLFFNVYTQMSEVLFAGLVNGWNFLCFAHKAFSTFKLFYLFYRFWKYRSTIVMKNLPFPARTPQTDVNCEKGWSETVLLNSQHLKWMIYKIKFNMYLLKNTVSKQNKYKSKQCKQILLILK